MLWTTGWSGPKRTSAAPTPRVQTHDFGDGDVADLVDVERAADPSGEPVNRIEVTKLLTELAVRLQHVPHAGSRQHREQRQHRLDQRQRNRHRRQHAS